MNQPRTPKQAETEHLVRYLLDQGVDEDNARGRVQNASVAVFDHYITDGPGYAGKLMVVMWSGAESLYQVFVWRQREMVPIDQEPGLRSMASSYASAT